MATLRITALNTTEGTLMEDSLTDELYTVLHHMDAAAVTWAAVTDKFPADLEV